MGISVWYSPLGLHPVFLITKHNNWKSNGFKDVEKNMDIFHFNNIYQSLVSFTLEFCPFLDGHMMSIANHILLLWIKFVLSSQLLPTLDIYTWTEEHVVGISVFLVTVI